MQHSQYIIKTYNKALHYRSKGFVINEKIIRFEIKFTKMHKINALKIYNLKDLINYGLHNFKKEILNEWKNVLYYDSTIQIDNLSAKLKVAVLKYSNPNYWTALLSKSQTKNFCYHKKQLKKLIAQNSNKVHNLTAEIITKKIDFLNGEDYPN